MKKKRMIICLAVVCVMAVNGVSAVSFQGLGFSDVRAISGNGRVVLGSGFRWSQSSGSEPLGKLTGYTQTTANALSYDGSVIVGYSGASGGVTEAFYWTESVGMVGLGRLQGGFRSYAWGVSGDGSVVVGRTDGDLPYSNGQAFHWTETTGMVNLGDLKVGRYSDASAISADASVIVGQRLSSVGHEAFILTESVGMVGLGSLDPRDISSWAEAVSADGSTVVGTSQSVSYALEAFRSYGTGMIGLGVLNGGTESAARDVSGDGSIIVGNSYGNGVGNMAFIWDNGMKNLKEVLVSDYGLDLTGWALTHAVGISDDGLTIVGIGINPYGYSEAWIFSVPEPTTLLLLGLGGLLLRRRHR